MGDTGMLTLMIGTLAAMFSALTYLAVSTSV